MTEAAIDARSTGQATEPVEGYDTQQDNRDETDSQDKTGQDKTTPTTTKLLPSIDHGTSHEYRCRRHYHLARPRTAKARKANVPSEADEPDNNNCIGRMQQQAGRELEHGKSLQCMCWRRWRHQGCQRPPRPMYRRNQEANNKCSGLLQQQSGREP